MHKELTVEFEHTWMANTTDAAEHYQIDIYGVAYNWLQVNLNPNPKPKPNPNSDPSP